jgi:hypothetical protein
MCSLIGSSVLSPFHPCIWLATFFAIILCNRYLARCDRFDPEDEGSMFLRNVGIHGININDYMFSQPRTPQSEYNCHSLYILRKRRKDPVGVLVNSWNETRLVIRLKFQILKVVTPCVVEIYRHFWGTYCFHFQGPTMVKMFFVFSPSPRSDGYVSLQLSHITRMSL